MSRKVKKPKPLMPTHLIDDRVHLLDHIGICCLVAGCGATMQPGSDTWDNEVNYWGKTGIRTERPFTTVTLDRSKVTCRRKGCKP